MKKTILIITLFAVAGGVSAQTITRKTVLSKGQQLSQTTEVNTNMTQEMMGQSMQIKIKSNLDNLVEVKDAMPSGYAVANTLKHVTMNFNGMGQEQSFDSDKKEDMDGQMGSAFKGKIGHASEFVVGKDGTITSVKKDDSASIDAGGMMGHMINGSLASEKEGALFTALANIPAKGVKVGESWVDSVNSDNDKSITTYTLKEVKDNSALVSLDGKVSVSREFQQQGMTMQMNMKGTTAGQYTFDTGSGIVTSRKAVTKANGTVEVMGQSVPVTVETTVVSNINRK